MNTEIKKQAINRLRRIEGQVRGLQKMIEEELYCIDIMTQSNAIKKALGGVEDLMLKNHLSTHVVHQMKHGQSDRAVEEIRKVYKLAQNK
jgi:CsoR family transcriptional regulator, copper-sensing transcriptional repressor